MCVDKNLILYICDKFNFLDTFSTKTSKFLEWFRNYAKLPTPHPRGMHLLRLPWKRDWPIGHDLRNSRSLVYA